MIRFSKNHFFIICITISFLILAFTLSYIYVNQNHKLNIVNTFENTKLTTHKGIKVSALNFIGYPNLIFFGFTHCPEVCPTTIGKLDNIINEINYDNKKIKIVFITLDPDRDTIENLNNYLEGFDNKVIGLTGKIDQIEKVAKKWNIFWEKTSYSKTDYNINHTATVFMTDSKGDFAGTISWRENPSSIRLKIKELLKY